MNISEFQGSINQRGVLQNNRFVAFFNVPKSIEKLQNRYGIQDKIISARCEAAQIPGVNLTTIDQPRLGYGPSEAMPHNVTLDDVSLTFLLDGQSSLHALFYEWFNTIVNFQGSAGQSTLKSNQTMGPGGLSIGSAFEVGYKDNYRTDIIIGVYNASAYEGNKKVSDIGVKVMEVKLFNAFPKTIPSVDLSWQNNDELIRLTVPFSYTDFKMSYPRHGTTFNPTIAAAITGPADISQDEAARELAEAADFYSENSSFTSTLDYA